MAQEFCGVLHQQLGLKIEIFLLKVEAVDQPFVFWC
jgi:hypothetical protein